MEEEGKKSVKISQKCIIENTPEQPHEKLNLLGTQS